MVTVVNTHKREGKNGSFIVLELLGNVEMVQSQNTGRFYATARRCTVPSSFDEATAQLMIGSRMPGNIERVQCEAYDYAIPESGEVIKLAHTYEYRPEKSQPFILKSPSQIPQSLAGLEAL